jgi:hypothetical protein
VENDRAELRGRATLDTTQWASGVRSLRRSVATFQNVIGRPLAEASRRLVRLGAVVAAAGAAAAAFAVRDAAQYGDGVDKMSRRTGLTAQAVSELGYAMGLAGSGSEALEKGVRRSNKFLYDLGRGLSTARVAADELGLSYEQLSAASPDQRLNAILAALSKISDIGRRGALAGEIFGTRGGASFLPLIDEGADALAAARKEAQLLGVALSPEQARGAATFTDEFERMRAALRGLAVSGAPLAEIAAGVRRITAAIVDLRQSGAFADATRAVAGFAAGTVRNTSATIQAWRNMTTEQQASLRTAGLSMAAFLVALQTGFVGAGVKALTYFATHSVAVSGTIAAAFSGLVGFIAGLKFGEAIEKKFDVSSMILRMREKMRHTMAMAKFQQVFEKGLLPERDATAMYRDLIRRHKDAMDAIAGQANEPEGAGFFATFLGELKTLPGQVTDALKGLLPQSVIDLTDEIGRLKNLNLPGLPDALKTQQAGEEMEEVVGLAEKLARITAPIRGMVTGFLRTNLLPEPGVAGMPASALARAGGTAAVAPMRASAVAADEQFTRQLQTAANAHLAKSSNTLQSIDRRLAGMGTGALTFA